MYGVAAATCFCATRTQWPRAHRRQRCKRLSCNLCAEAAAFSEPAARGISGRLTANRFTRCSARLLSLVLRVCHVFTSCEPTGHTGLGLTSGPNVAHPGTNGDPMQRRIDRRGCDFGVRDHIGTSLEKSRRTRRYHMLKAHREKRGERCKGGQRARTAAC